MMTAATVPKSRVSLRQAAAMIGVHHETLRQWVLDGTGPRCFARPCIKRTCYRFDPRDVDDFIRHHSKGQAQ